ncbi:G-protein coupled receptor 4-like [Enoplosus armatus]|uniref:G-protein coupled receptor 4-like n=1 Tax=Enoplosus armatus TaxID=215367 RepID=UPI003995B7A3
MDTFYDYDYFYDYNDSDLYYYDYDFGNYTIFEEFDFYKSNDLSAVTYVIAWIVICIGFPVTLLAIYALYSMVRDDHVAPVYVINLLVSDLIQICCLVIWVAEPRKSIIFIASKCIYFIGVIASVGFMVCVALERYLVIACPLWYRFRRSVKLSVMVSIIVWVLSIIEFLIALLTPNILHPVICRSVLLLIPFPLLVFSLAGTLKALSAAICVPLKEKRRIVGTLVVVLLNYTMLFLPWVIWLLGFSHIVSDSGFYLSFLQFSPLADLVLYVFMRKGAVDKLLVRLCCCRMTREEEQGSTTNDKTTEEACSA